MKKFFLLFLVLLNFSINLGMSRADIINKDRIRNFNLEVLNQDKTQMEQSLKINPDLVNLPLGKYFPLATAAARGYIDLVVLLLSMGANVNYIHQGYNALYWTITSRPRDIKNHILFFDNMFEIAYMLIREGINIEFQFPDGSTALHSASFFGYNRILQLLLDCHINIKARNSLNKTALHCALLNRYRPEEEILVTVKLLVEAGVDINTKAYIKKIKCSALDLAREKNYKNIARYLIKNGAIR